MGSLCHTLGFIGGSRIDQYPATNRRDTPLAIDSLEWRSLHCKEDLKISTWVVHFTSLHFAAALQHVPEMFLMEGVLEFHFLEKKVRNLKSTRSCTSHNQKPQMEEGNSTFSIYTRRRNNDGERLNIFQFSITLDRIWSSSSFLVGKHILQLLRLRR